jgi:hypothetical protein
MVEKMVKRAEIARPHENRGQESQGRVVSDDQTDVEQQDAPAEIESEDRVEDEEDHMRVERETVRRTMGRVDRDHHLDRQGGPGDVAGGE